MGLHVGDVRFGPRFETPFETKVWTFGCLAGPANVECVGSLVSYCTTLSLVVSRSATITVTARVLHVTLRRSRSRGALIALVIEWALARCEVGPRVDDDCNWATGPARAEARTSCCAETSHGRYLSAAGCVR